MSIKHLLLFPLFSLMMACGSSSSQTEIVSNEVTTTPPLNAEPATTTTTSKTSTSNNTAFDPSTIDDAAAERIKNFLIHSFLVRDMPLMEDSDKQFQLFKIDLNEDGVNEYFVRFNSSYFCGSNGCTTLLLNNNLTLINRYNVLEAPFYVTNKKENGWRTLMVKSEKAFRALISTNGKYPAELLGLPKSNFIPSDEATTLFGSSPAKTYNFSEKPLDQIQKGNSQQRVSVFQRTYNTGSFVFKVNATNGETTPIHISSVGLPRAFDETIEVEGAVKEGHLLDLDNDGFKELYLLIHPTGDSGNIELLGISSYRDKSAGAIIVKDTKEVRQVNSDRVFVENKELRRSFTQGGKQMNFKYALEKGETGFVLRAVKI